MKRPTKSHVTIYDVADHAGVAISTVSRVLNGSPDVSDLTRKKVEQAIADLKYHPNRTARSLAQQDVRSLAVALPSFTAPFQNELLKGIRAYLREIEHDLLICDLGSTEQESSLRKFMARGAVRGLLLCGMPISDQLATELADGPTPCVLIGHIHPSFDYWAWDDEAGSKRAVKHLIAQGHRNIAMIRSSVDSESQMQRVSGYKNALKEAGIPVREDWIVAGHAQYHAGFSEEDGQDAMERILDALPNCSAVFCSSDVQAIGAMSALRAVGKRIPEDMAVLGYDDIKTSRFLGLSSVDQQMQAIGRAAAECLYLRASDSPLGERQQTLIQPELAIRRSSVKAASA
ncbi:MAG: LacI family DNA-binding transcriptional regulator [Bacteroidota bacterium]|nr:LacI family DNA-binding transcriptional regulator [Bacteroidota bacterium]